LTVKAHTLKAVATDMQVNPNFKIILPYYSKKQMLLPARKYQRRRRKCPVHALGDNISNHCKPQQILTERLPKVESHGNTLWGTDTSTLTAMLGQMLAESSTLTG